MIILFQILSSFYLKRAGFLIQFPLKFWFIIQNLASAIATHSNSTSFDHILASERNFCFKTSQILFFLFLFGGLKVQFKQFPLFWKIAFSPTPDFSPLQPHNWPSDRIYLFYTISILIFWSILEGLIIRSYFYWKKFCYKFMEQSTTRSGRPIRPVRAIMANMVSQDEVKQLIEAARTQLISNKVYSLTCLSSPDQLWLLQTVKVGSKH